MFEPSLFFNSWNKYSKDFLISLSPRNKIISQEPQKYVQLFNDDVYFLDITSPTSWILYHATAKHFSDVVAYDYIYVQLWTRAAPMWQTLFSNLNSITNPFFRLQLGLLIFVMDSSFIYYYKTPSCCYWTKQNIAPKMSHTTHILSCRQLYETQFILLI